MAQILMSSVFSDQDTNLDANALLTELDKGLRSNEIGEQCEAIVRFPWLFQRYPFPILINSACLKLAELFRNGSNFLRVLILKVMQQSEKHLDKILNVDELVRRFFAVTFSNDPVARALTLRVFGIISEIVSQRRNIHHCILNSLDSKDELEINAAIEASARFAAKCADFAGNIYPKILTMIANPETRLETKINLLSVLDHVPYNAGVAAEVRSQCVQFLPNCQSEQFVICTLHTMTRITATSLTQFPDQIDLLLRYFTSDSPKSVKLVALKELYFLAQTNPHLWQRNSIETLINYFQSEPPDRTTPAILCKVLSILGELIRSSCLLVGESDYYRELHDKIMKLCLRNIVEKQNNALVISSLCLMTNLATNSTYLCNEQLSIQETCAALQNFLLSGLVVKSKFCDQTLKKVCCNAVLMVRNYPNETKALVEAFKCLVTNSDKGSVWFGLSCDSLCAIGLTAVSSEDFNFRKRLLIMLNDKKLDEALFVKAFTLFAQYSADFHISIEEIADLLQSLNERSLWCCFKVVRQAMRFGHHLLSWKITQQMRDMASTENVHFWLQSLCLISEAENVLNVAEDDEDLDAKLKTSISFYVEGCATLKAVVTPNCPLKFQCSYVRLRSKYLQTHSLFRQCCKLIRTSPPPAIASSAALNARDDLLICGNVVTVMRRCAKEFRVLAESYNSLYESSFNADNHSLAHLQLLQHSCIIVAEAIESIFQNNRLNALFVAKDSPFQGDANTSSFIAPLEHKRLIEVCSKISKQVQHDLLSTSEMQTVKETINAKQIAMLNLISTQLLKIPLCIPRFFFQSIQDTCIKLAISPQPKSAGDLIIISNTSSLALRVEGVVVHNNTLPSIRKINKVLLNVVGSAISKQVNNEQMTAKPGSDSVNLHSVVFPHNDYFQAQFLLSLPLTGLYSITVETCIIDDNEAQWKTGPVISLSAKVVEDSSSIMTCK